MNVDQHVLNRQDQAEDWDLTRSTSADDGRRYGTRAARVAVVSAAWAEQAWLDERAHLGGRLRARRLEERAALGQRAQFGLDLENQNPNQRPDPTRNRWFPLNEHREQVIRRRAEHAQARAAGRTRRRLEHKGRHDRER